MLSGHEVILGLCVWICISKFCGVKAQHSIDDVINPVRSHVDVWQELKPRVAAKPTDGALCEPQVYYCEVPEGHYLVPENHTKFCDYRNVQFHEQVYRWVAGRGCLLYTPDFLYQAGYNTLNLNAACYYGDLYGPCMEIKNSDGSCSCYPFDPGLEEVVSAVREATIPAAHGRWEQCYYEARDCCSYYMGQESGGDEGSHCRATFDGWTCWPDTKVDTVASEVCSDFAYSNARPSCNHYSTKQCYATGAWEIQTDYGTCSITPRLLLRYRYHVAMLALSLATCVPAIVIFCFYKRLWVTRVALHRNLLIAIVIRNLAVAVSRGEIYIDELTNSGTTVMSNNGVMCRILATVDRIAGNAVFFFMLMEGIYLHRTIVTVFKKKLKMNVLYAVGAVLILAPVIAWAIIMAVLNDHSCWLVYTVNHIQWVIDVPRIAILLVNLALFVDILRVLLTKIRNSENSNQLNTTKATLFLMPLFGVQFLLTVIRIPTDNCTGEQAYYFIAYTVEALQGSIVAVLYCYNNKEVHQLLKGTYKKTETAVVSIVRPESNYRRSTLGPKSNRRMTYSTTLDPQPHKSCPESPLNLHEAEIVSIQTSERFAEILDPVYESFAGVVNEGYESVESQEIESAPAQPESKSGEEFIYTQTPSSIDGQDWIKCISSAGSSVYSNSLDDYEIKYLENKFPERVKRKSFRQAVQDILIKNKFKLKPSLRETCKSDTNNSSNVNMEPSDNMESIKEDVSETDDDNKGMEEEKWDDYEDSDDSMYEAIMQIIQTNGNNEADQALDPELLSPNRKDDDKIIFVP